VPGDAVEYSNRCLEKYSPKEDVAKSYLTLLNLYQLNACFGAVLYCFVLVLGWVQMLGAQLSFYQTLGLK
jgi:hypothetical protein